MLDIYSEITNRVIAALESGVAPWRKPWTGGSFGCVSFSSGRPYSLLNHLLLGNISGEYLTYRQAVLAGGYVRKGAKGKMVVFWKPYEKVDEETGEVIKRFILKHFTVFHTSQCENISPRWAVVHPVSDLQPDAAAEAVIKGYIARSGVRFTSTLSDRAFYNPSTDEIVVPQLSQYKQLTEYYQTTFHEMLHSSGHHSRLNRISDVAAFGSHEYGKEELVAELGASYLVNYCALESEASFSNSVGYIQSWLAALKNDKRLLISAAGAAEKAVDFILGRREGESDDEADGQDE